MSVLQDQAAKLLTQVRDAAQGVGPVQFMEVCGTHTMALFRSGIRSVLPDNVTLLSGPGCPVCVTPQGWIDAACAVASRDGVIVCTYGDMLRVPGRHGSLEKQRAAGADVRVVYSARDAVRLADRTRDKTIVFLGVGFETTAPGTAAAVLEAEGLGLDNFLVMTAHKLVTPAMQLLLRDGAVPIDGFLAPGHVSVIIGASAFQPIAEMFGKPCVVAGFEPVQILKGLLRLLALHAEGSAAVENVYPAAVTEAGNAVAKDLLERSFVVADSRWRAMGEIKGSGLELAPQYERFDAIKRLAVTIPPDEDPVGCRCGEVIQGKVTPADCDLFGIECTPHEPVGPCMVSSEGTCSAWYKYGGAACAGRA